MIDKKTLKTVLDLALANGGDFADIFVEKKITTGISAEGGKIERVHSGIDAGAGLRVLAGDMTAYAYTNDLGKESLLEIARTVGRTIKTTDRKEYNFDLRKVKPVVDFSFPERPDKVETSRKAEMVESADKATRQVNSELIKQVMVGYGDVIQQVTIANSAGDYVEDERIRTRFLVHAVAGDGAVIQTGYEAAGSLAGFDLLKRYPPEELGRKAGERAIQMLSAKPAPAGKFPVVMSGEAGGTMVHEACGHGLEADLVQKKLSVYAGKMGEQVASKEATIIDDATLSDRYGSYRFDDEGTPSRKVVLIEDGILKDYLYDRMTAGRDGKSSNGHGRRESYQHKPIPRMGNTFIAPGKADPEKIISQIKNGLLVKKMGGGQVNTTTGDFVFDVAEGYLIVDGQVGPMVRGATLTGNGPEVLKMLEMVGRDLGFTIGTCGKDGQGVPVSDAQPTLLIRELIVGGTQVSTNSQIRRI